MKITRRTAIGSLVATVAGTVPAFAQAFPNKPVKIVVGFAAGGGTDFVARILADALKDRWGQSVMVESRTGASGMLAAEQVVRSAPDGYTLLVSPQTSIAVAPQIFAKSPYDPLKDLTPITILTATPMLLVAHPSFPASTFAEFLAYVRANPGKVTFASGGIGSSPHMTSELLNMQLGLKAVHVPYRGEQPALADVMGNQVGVLFANIPSGMPYVQAGKLKALVTTGQTRSPLAPDVPTIVESGAGDIVTATWNGLYGPAGMAPELVQKIYTDVKDVLGQGAVRERLIASGSDMVLNTPQRFQEYLKAEVTRWGKVIKAADIRAE
ncbi:tripartite tricarboxylate transporter substrate binding protein [Reyranella sp. MMS21-HV4-11]|jgi:tripartite-type tricarboxylate transporter receptor subunit TctC|uniref:Tripartite tricarboxylate transporter substrate binding protein n=1 Tax=Reyranella humidisoli TaxID=2849149 RepID=A0ABS6IIV6_9HYPH|nr:tripartite tricarboxylate transporter substrate binding protein [Reyranella sp. MMS21-HV4-11]MBU8874529.1 tripartite tricarboxylate transporter substrate binding protein [Reyranella sp. MMS21-HV4-11]